MNRHMVFMAAALVCLATRAPASDSPAGKATARVQDATEVVGEFAGMEGAPTGLAGQAAGIVVIPGLKKAGFVLGAEHGSGLLSVRHKDGTWSQPVFVKLTGGSIGFQIGVSSTDLVLLFMRERNIGQVIDGEFTIGGDATVAAGPVGRSGTAATSANLEAEIYSYSRSRGAFAGISIDGSKLYVDDAADEAIYGAKAAPRDIVAGKPAVASPALTAFRNALRALTTQKSGEAKSAPDAK